MYPPWVRGNYYICLCFHCLFEREFDGPLSVAILNQFLFSHYRVLCMISFRLKVCIIYKTCKSIVCAYYPGFSLLNDYITIYSLVDDGQLNCFQFFAVMNASINILCVSWCILLRESLECTLRSQFAGF